MQTRSYWGHYDAYVAAVYSPMGIASSLLLISLIASQKQARAFPGNLILTVTTAHLLLLLQNMPGSLPVDSSSATDPSGQLRPLSLELTCVLSFLADIFQITFLFAILVLFSASGRPKTQGVWFWSVPALLASILFFTNVVISMDHTHSADTSSFGSNALLIELDLALLSLALGVWAWMVLGLYREKRKQRVGVREDFFFFYQDYTLITLAFNGLLFFSYLCILGAEPCGVPLSSEGTGGLSPPQQPCGTLLAIGKLGLSFRPLLPVFAAIAKLADPFTKKLLRIDVADLELRQSGVKVPVNDDSLLLSKDLVAPTEIQSLQEAMARTLVMGLGEYYRTWSEFYTEDSDAAILEKVVHVLKHDRMNSFRDIESSLDRFGLECEVSSHAAQAFLRVIKSHLILDIQKSFNLSLSADVVRNSSDRNVQSSLHFSFLTWDRRFHVRSLTEAEYRVFRPAIPDYADHLCANRFSLLSKIVGLFTFRYISTGQKVRLCVTENVFLEEEQFFRRRYELQGFREDRQVLVKPRAELERLKARRIPETLQDEDFGNLDGSFALRNSDRDFLAMNLRRDVAFLLQRELIGYSLLVGVVDTQDLDQAQLEHFSELSSLKIAFLDAEKRHVLFFGISGFFQRSGWFTRLLVLLRRKGGDANGVAEGFVRPATAKAFASGFLSCFEGRFLGEPGSANSSLNESVINL